MDDSTQPEPAANGSEAGSPQPCEVAGEVLGKPSTTSTGPPWVFLDIFRMLLYVACSWIVMLFVILTGLVAATIVLGDMPEFFDPENTALLLTLTAVSEMLFVFYLYRAAAKRYKQSFWKAINWFRLGSRETNYFLGGIGLAILSLTFHYYAQTPISPFWSELMRDTTTAYLVALFGISVGPFIEEVVFRGFLFPICKNLTGVSAAILINTILFGAIHLPSSLPGWIDILFFGAVVTYYRWKTDSLISSYLLHAANNLTAFGLIYVTTNRFRDLAGC